MTVTYLMKIDEHGENIESRSLSNDDTSTGYSR